MGWLTVLPPLLAIVIAVWKREVNLALLVAIFSAEFLIAGFNPALAFLETINRIIGVFSSSGNTEILVFCLLIGALLALIKKSGGVSSFVHYVLEKGLAKSPRSASLITSLLGIVIFIESNLSVLATGIFAQSLFDKYKMSRARLAFIIDSTCSPVSVLILLNAWGAYILGLLEGYGLDNTVSIMINSIPLNFYAIIILILVFYTSWSNKVFFTLSSYEANNIDLQPYEADSSDGKIRYFLVPLFILIFGTIFFMFYTGNGILIEGSGSSSVLYATILAIVSAFLLLRIDRIFRHKQLLEVSFQGMSELLPLVTIILLAITLGSSMRELGTGEFVAGMISDSLALWSIAPVVFITAAMISFATGTSWGTFALLIPVAIPIALTTGLSPSLLLAAVLGGGVFGDHCSPISDSTILASLASGCDHLDHVRTQIPYALTAALLSVPLFIVFGL